MDEKVKVSLLLLDDAVNVQILKGGRFERRGVLLSTLQEAEGYLPLPFGIFDGPTVEERLHRECIAALRMTTGAGVETVKRAYKTSGGNMTMALWLIRAYGTVSEESVTREVEARVECMGVLMR